ncbi:MAG: DNA adenine methylase [Planctomycetia bacterium]|nr:DNA adenine methylase [Planctomycetia bacterium]
MTHSQNDPQITEGIKYAGSKRLLIPHILEMVRSVNVSHVLDGFSGTSRVSQALAKSGYQVTANDISIWSETFGLCYLCNDKPPQAYEGLISHLNHLKPISGWFTEHYGGHENGGVSVQSDGCKKPWQIHNTQKLDAIRSEIDRLNLTPIERAVALTSLILALDAVDNTLGHQAAYLYRWAPRSYHPLTLRIPQTFVAVKENFVSRANIFDVLPHTVVDLAYFDPPYGSNNVKMPSSRIRYAAYYHLWTTICLNDFPPLFGKAKRRQDTSDLASASIFENFRQNPSGHFIAVEAIRNLLQNTRAKWIILSYSSGGRATAEELNDVMKEVGVLRKVKEISYRKHAMAEMTSTGNWLHDAQTPNREFLFLLEKE